MSDTLFGPASGAVLSADGRYRYELTRIWDVSVRPLGWLMLNPSTADAAVDDPTIRRCVRFARDAGYGGIVVRNLFAYRAADPSELLTVGEPVGPDNLDHLGRCVGDVRTVAAWGAHKAVEQALRKVGPLLHRTPLVCLGTTASGAPRHPLYVRAETPLQPFYLDRKWA